MVEQSGGTSRPEIERVIELSEGVVRKALDSLNPPPPQSASMLMASGDTGNRQPFMSNAEIPPPDADG